MADEQQTKLRLEIAHVLFIDIVGYSKRLIDEQSEALHELNQIVRITEAARALTGFTLNRFEGKFEYRPFMHDNGSKTVLGKTGNLDGNDPYQ